MYTITLINATAERTTGGPQRKRLVAWERRLLIRPKLQEAIQMSPPRHSRSRTTADGVDRSVDRAVDRRGEAPDGVIGELGSSERMPLPHERDESAATNSAASTKTPEQGEVIGRAGADLASGQQDTDCRNRAPGQADCPPRPAVAQGRDAAAPKDREPAASDAQRQAQRATAGGRR